MEDSVIQINGDIKQIKAKIETFENETEVFINLWPFI